MKTLCVLLLSCVTVYTAVHAQGLNSDGRDFYLGYVEPSIMRQTIAKNPQGFFAVYALVNSYADNEITVSYFDSLGNETAAAHYFVAKRRAIQVPLDINKMRVQDPTERATWTACHISARLPVSITYFSTGACAGGSYLAATTSALGRTYVIQSYTDNVNGVGGVSSHEKSVGFFMVIAAFDSTNATITPTSTTAGNHPGVNCGLGSNGTPVPYTVMLRRGQCYLVKSLGDSVGCDISGSTVIASKPVAVLAGHENAFTAGSDTSMFGRMDARDFMIEEMLPVEYWDSTGYVSIPYVDSQSPSRGGEGDEYRVFSGSLPGGGGPSSSNIELNGGSKSFTGVRSYQAPPAVLNWQSPVDFYSTDRTKIGVAQFDQRMQGGGAPYPAPSQLTVIPKSRWKKTYSFLVANNMFESLQGYYVNIICDRVTYDNRKFLIAVNGGKPSPLPNGLAVKKKYSVVPDNPSLVGYSMALGPGAYYFTTDSGSNAPYGLYVYGSRGIDPDRDFGDLDDDDYFFSYANPSGFVMRGSEQGVFVVTLDSLCDHWHVCIHRRGGLGIKSIQLLQDLSGDLRRPGAFSVNARFAAGSPGLLKPYPNELVLTGDDTTVCTDIESVLGGDSGHVALWILDENGNDTVIERTIRPRGFRVGTGSGSFGGLTDTVEFGMDIAGIDTCLTLSLILPAGIGSGNVQVDLVALTHGSPFSLQPISPPLPAILRAGDTVRMRLCFFSRDIGTYTDSLVVTTSCGTQFIPVFAHANIPKIYATDKNFGSVAIGSSVSDTITIRNVGGYPFTLTDTVFGASIVHLNHDFQWDNSSKYNKNRFPVVMQPGSSVPIALVYAPTALGKDSAVVHWQTDVPATFKDSVKPWSALSGVAIPVLSWNRDIDAHNEDSLRRPIADTVRVFLRNLSTRPVIVHQVLFRGLDAHEFDVIDNQPGYRPLEGFILQPQDSIWVDVAWEADMSIPYPDKFRDRTATLVATYDNFAVLDSTAMQLVRRFAADSTASVWPSEATSSESLRATLAAGSLTIWWSRESAADHFELYDLLGRRIWMAHAPTLGENSLGPIVMAGPLLHSGIYVLRAVGTDGQLAECKLLVRN